MGRQYTTTIYKARAAAGNEVEGGGSFARGLDRVRSLCADLFTAYAAAPSARHSASSDGGGGGGGEAVLSLQGYLALLRRVGIVRPVAADAGGAGMAWGPGDEGAGYRLGSKVGQLGEGDACAVFEALRVPDIDAAAFQARPATPGRRRKRAAQARLGWTRTGGPV